MGLHKGLWLILINWTAQLFAVVSHTEIVTGYETENKKEHEWDIYIQSIVRNKIANVFHHLLVMKQLHSVLQSQYINISIS